MPTATKESSEAISQLLEGKLDKKTGAWIGHKKIFKKRSALEILAVVHANEELAA